MTKRKPLPRRDEHGRFLPHQQTKVWYEDCGGTLWGAVVDDFTPTGEIYRRPYCDQIYRPERKPMARKTAGLVHVESEQGVSAKPRAKSGKPLKISRLPETVHLTIPSRSQVTLPIYCCDQNGLFWVIDKNGLQPFSPATTVQQVCREVNRARRVR